jgi:predicted dehydrogenase
MPVLKTVRVGIIGCGEVTQVVHLPTLGFLSSLFKVTALCDVSADALSFCSTRLAHPHKTTTSPAEVCASHSVDVVFVVNSDEYHVEHILLALEYGKHVFVEKPMALCLRDADRVIEMEKKSGKKVMVGYMRRYAKVFADALKELGGAGEVAYARVRGESFLENHIGRSAQRTRYKCAEPYICGPVRHLPHKTYRYPRGGPRGPSEKVRGADIPGIDSRMRG